MVIISLVGGVGLWQLTLHLPTLLPAFFPDPPSYAFIDALTKSMSFVATYLIIKRKISCLYYWIMVDIIGIWLYFVKEVKFLSLLYLIFLFLATKGYFSWRKSVQQQKAVNLV